MGGSGFVNRGTDAAGTQIATFKSATDETDIQKMAWTDDDGTLLGTATDYLFVVEKPHCRSHGQNEEP